MDIETTPRVEFLKHNLDLHKGQVERFAQRLKNIEDNPEPDEKVRVVVFYRNGEPEDSAVRAMNLTGDARWFLTGYEEPQTWEEIVDNVASVYDDFKITVHYVVDMADLLGRG